MPCPQTLCRIWEMKKSTSMSFFPFYTRVCYNFVSTNKHHWYIEPSCLYAPSESPRTIDHKIVEKDEHQKPKSHTNNCITIISRWVASTVQLQGCAKGKTKMAAFEWIPPHPPSEPPRLLDDEVVKKNCDHVVPLVTVACAKADLKWRWDEVLRLSTKKSFIENHKCLE